MIKEWVAPSKDVYGKDEILSDRDITISYEPIQITENIRIVISKMQIKDNEAKIILSVNRSNIEWDETFPLYYKVYNSKKESLCNQSGGPEDTVNTYTQELILKNYSEEDKVLTLEIYTADNKLITTMSIDLENKEINVLGQEEHIEKISEIELKEFLGSISKQHVADSASGTCIDITSMSYSAGYYTVTYTYCFLGEKSLFDIDINDIDIYKNTVAIKLNEEQTESKFELVSIEEPIIIQKNMSITNRDTGTPLWADFVGTFALKSAFNQGNEINPKEWSTWSDNNWVVFHEDGTFTDTLFSKIFTDSLTVSGTYKFKNNSVVLTYSNGEVITLEGDIENYYLTGKIDEYNITIEAYAHSDLSKRDVKFVGGWYLQYGLDWSTGEAKKLELKALYDEEIYGAVYGANITLGQEGSIEYSIAGTKKISRRIGKWENVVISDNKIKVTLDDGTIIYMKYELDENGNEYIGFQSKYNDMYYEYYSKDEVNNSNENNDSNENSNANIEDNNNNEDNSTNNIEDNSKEICGDVNCDGQVNTDDVDYLSNHLSNELQYQLTEQANINADVNQDGTVNLKDKTILSRHIQNLAGYETLPYTE